MMEWRPIESAEENVELLLWGAIHGDDCKGAYDEPEKAKAHLSYVFTNNNGARGRFILDHCSFYEWGYATHWALPEPPETA